MNRQSSSIPMLKSLRRSNSASNIPIARKSALDVDSKRHSRSKSNSRESFTKSRSLLSVNNPHLKTPQSFQYQPRKLSYGSSARSPRTPLLKINDKKQLEEHFAKVQRFLEASQLFDLEIANPGNIKPPSIKTFVYMCSVLFGEIFHKIKITNENYKEMVPIQLKLLRYPGSLTNSVLRIVNTMHSWPQVIVMFSWLVDLISICIFSNTSFVNISQDFKLVSTQIACNFCSKAYLLFNNGDGLDCESFDEVYQEFRKEMENLLKVDYDKHEVLLKQVKSSTDYIESQLQLIQKEDEEIAQLQNDVYGLKEEMAKMDEETDVELFVLNQDIINLTTKKDGLMQTKTVREENVGKLEDLIRQQPCTSVVYKELLQSVDHWKEKIVERKKTDEVWRNLKSQYDSKLSKFIREIEAEVNRWNRIVITIFHGKPEYKSLLLREKCFHSETFLKEIETIDRLKCSVEEKYRIASDELKKTIDNKKEAILDMRNDYKRREKCCTDQILENNVLKEKIIECKMEIKTIENEWIKEKEYVEEKVRKLQHDYKSLFDDHLIVDLKHRQNQLNEELEVLKTSTVAFFKEVHKTSMENFRQMDTIRINILNCYRERAKKNLQELESIQNILQKYPGLISD